MIYEQEILERYVENEVAEAVEKTDKEASIRTFIETCREFGATVAETIQKVACKYAPGSITAEREVQKYWK